ncbi:MAG: VOC family protein [Pyrinomonadaceae bacterium]
MTIARPTKFAHVVYRTRRFQEMLDWYQTVFDARIQHQNPVMAFLTYDDEHHRVAVVDMSALQPDAVEMERDDVTGIDHVAYTYASLGDLFENYAALKPKGITPYWCVHHGITISMYYADPDGNQMEFQVDCFENSEDATSFMNTKFEANPVGVEYNPDEWLSRLRSGTQESDFWIRHTDEPISQIRGAIAEMI